MFYMGKKCDQDKISCYHNHNFTTCYDIIFLKIWKSFLMACVQNLYDFLAEDQAALSLDMGLVAVVGWYLANDTSQARCNACWDCASHMPPLLRGMFRGWLKCFLNGEKSAIKSFVTSPVNGFVWYFCCQQFKGIWVFAWEIAEIRTWRNSEVTKLQTRI